MGVTRVPASSNEGAETVYSNHVVTAQPRSVGALCGIKVDIVDNPTDEESCLSNLQFMEGVGLGLTLAGTCSGMPTVGAVGGIVSCTSFILDQMIQDGTSEKTRGNICFPVKCFDGAVASSTIALGAQALVAPAEALGTPFTFTVKLAVFPACLLAATILPNVAVFSSSRVGN